MRAGRKEVFAALRQEIRRLDGQFRPHQALPFGVAEVDIRLPGGGLARGALHEVTESGSAAEFSGSATLFTAGIAARLKGPVLWCLNRRDLFAPGLVNVGLHPDRVLYAETFRERDILPAMEEGLRERGLAAVIGEVTRLGLTASRRLQLAAEASGVPVFVLRRWWSVAEKELTTLPSAATTRWRISPFMSHAPPAPGLARARWHVDLLRCRGGEPHSWILEACDAKGRLALPADLADRPDQAPWRQAAVR
ncbi:ImuA family protein [Microvirga brassicacearum]|uniref:Damage-inducible mutagenesis protein n=1 Tax=Microvirga brassicacearum TaxID=2580413 RepID=A0A5N3P4U7_9HYPH|nr:damage-inducible mutagenesis protein [Microvirga brassicacearum]KAB0264739.1 damage-inducible mutagenesis protein [Microvirga brassicacearum]